MSPRTLTACFALVSVLDSSPLCAQPDEVPLFVQRLIDGAIDDREVIAFLNDPEIVDGTDAGRMIQFSSPAAVLVLYGSNRLRLYRPPAVTKLENLGKAVDTASTPDEFANALAALEGCDGKCQSQTNKFLIRLQALDSKTVAPLQAQALQLSVVERATKLKSSISTSRLPAHREQLRAALTRQLTESVSKLRTRATANRAIAALPQAKSLLSNGQFSEAWAIVSPFTSNAIISAALPELGAMSWTWVAEQANKSIEAKSFGALAEFVEIVGTVPDELVSAAQKSTLLDRIADATLAMAVSRMWPGSSANSVEAMRLLAWRSGDLLVSEQERKLLELFEFPTLSSSANIAASGSCAIDSAYLRDFVRSKIHPVANRDEGSSLTFDITPTCEISDSAGPVERVPSAYTAGIQQLANPDYEMAQAQLADARASLAKLTLEQALNPPVGAWAGAAAGLAKGLAEVRVSTAQRRLIETPPFLERPVSAPYSAVKRTITRTGTMRFRIRLNDADTGFTDTREASMFGELSDDEFTGVMTTDERGLRNKEAVLPQASALHALILKSDATELERSFNELLQSALLTRAQNGDDKVKRLGSLLFAYDIGPNSSLMTPVAGIVKALSDAPLAALLSVNPPAPPARPAKPVPAVNATANKSSRVNVAATALRALVRITSSTGSGTGFLVSADGLVVSNAHVVGNATRLTARNMDGEEFLMSIVATDDRRDLALLRVVGWNAEPLRVDDTGNVSVGEDVLAVGNPLGLEGTVTRGIVSAKRRIDDVAVIQIDAAISPGSSGGPLLNEQGDVIGITSWKINSERTSAESLGFAVAAPEITKAFGARLK